MGAGAATPEYKRLRALAAASKNSIAAAFTIAHNGDKVVKEDATGLLNYVLEDAKKDFTITRFKGLGEMNPSSCGTPR